MNLESVLNTPLATKIQAAIGRKANSPVFEKLQQEGPALDYIQTNLCMAYLFARYTIPKFASYVFSNLSQRGPVDDEMGKTLEGIMGLVQGELFNNNIFGRPGECHSHYFDIVEAFGAAGGDLKLVEEFTELEQEHGITAIEKSKLWNPWCIRHTRSSAAMYEDPLAMFIMIPATEELSPQICGRALENLSPDSRFDAYRTFLRKHVELDEDDHGPAALKWLDSYIKTTDQNKNEIERSASKVLYVMTGKWS